MTRKQNSFSVFAIGLGAIALTLQACGASATTPQLLNARRAYDLAQMSPGAKLTPDQMLRARQALDAAEAAHKRDPGSAREAHLAYLADRKAQQSLALGKIAEAKQGAQEAKGKYVASLEAGAAEGQKELHAERAERKAADERAAAVLAELATIGQIQKQDRGTVLTISGAVLFAQGKNELSASAQQSLGKVASALQQQSPGEKIRIEGYTDSRGSDETNQRLSQERAEAVRDYLVRSGVDASELEAVGRGKANPIASNDTAEGRATNRRVEIVIPPPIEQASR